MHESRLANLLGACGLAVADRVRDVTAGLNQSSAAAVVVPAAGPSAAPTWAGGSG